MKRNVWSIVVLGLLFISFLIITLPVISKKDGPAISGGPSQSFSALAGNWAAPQSVSGGVGGSAVPAAVSDAQGNIHLVWQAAGIFYRVWNGSKEEWGPVERISTESSAASFGPDLAVDQRGNVHVVWWDRTNYSGSGGDDDIFYKRRTPAGGWTLTEVVSVNSSGLSVEPAIAVDFRGDVHVLWEEWPQICYRRLNMTSELWGPIETLSTQTPCISPSISADQRGQVHATWTAAFKTVICRTLNLTTLNWGPCEPVPVESPNQIYYSHSVCDGMSNLYVAWISFNASSGLTHDLDFKYQNASTGSWAPTEHFFGMEFEDDYSLTTDGMGRCYYALATNNGVLCGSWDAKSKAFSTLDWVYSTTYGSFSPIVVVDGQRRPHVLWSERTSIIDQPAIPGVVYAATISYCTAIYHSIALYYPPKGPVTRPYVSTPIIIRGDSMFAEYGFPGQGTSSGPYRIENLIINATAFNYICGLLVFSTTAYFIVRNCTVINKGLVGMEFYLVKHGTITNNTVLDCREGIYLSDYSGIGADRGIIEDTVTRNCVRHNEIGIVLAGGWRDSRFNNVSDNLAEYNGVGIEVLNSDNTTIAANRAFHNQLGIGVSACENATVEGNTASFNSGEGLSISSTTAHSLIYRNIMEANAYGMRLFGPHNDTIFENSAVRNRIGFSLDCCGRTYPTNLTLLRNTAINNTDYSYYLTVLCNNRLINNTAQGPGAVGFGLLTTHWNLFLNNTVRGHNIGILATNANNNTFSGNSVQGNNFSFRGTSCGGNWFERNNFTLASSPPIAQHNRVHLNWTPIPNMLQFYIYRASSLSALSPNLPPLATTQNASYDDEVENTGTYFYLIVAEDAQGNRYVSNAQSISVQDLGSPPIPSLGYAIFAVELIGAGILGVVIYRIATSGSQGKKEVKFYTAGLRGNLNPKQNLE